MKLDRLPGCDKWHPQDPPKLVFQEILAPRGPLMRRRCRVCDRNRKREANEKTYAVQRAEPYGVIPLTWPPPEGVIHDGSC